MWFALSRGQKAVVELESEQTVWPLPGGDGGAVTVTIKAELEEEIVLASAEALRLAYRVCSIDGRLKLSNDETLLDDAKNLVGHRFELMLTGKGAFLPPAKDQAMAAALKGVRMVIVDEVRMCWLVLPPALSAGMTFHPPMSIAAPSGARATIDATARVVRLDRDQADVEVEHTLAGEVTSLQGVHPITGTGTLTIAMTRTQGPTHVERMLSIQRDKVATLIRVHSTLTRAPTIS